MTYAVTMKPTSLAKKASRICAEYLVEVEAGSKEEAIIEARKRAEREGMRGYAITKITAVKQ